METTTTHGHHGNVTDRTHTKRSSAMVLPLLALTFATWAVYLSGLASLQAHCQNGNSSEVQNYVNPNTGDVYQLGGSGTAYLNGVVGFSANALPCSRVYRYWWFVMAFELFVIVGAAVTVATGMLFHAKLSFLGLFAVAFMLYIQASNDFLMVESVQYYQHGQPRHRLRTTVAGAIMTATMNAFVIFALGMEDALTTGGYMTKDGVNQAPVGPNIGHNGGHNVV